MKNNDVSSCFSMWFFTLLLMFVVYVSSGCAPKAPALDPMPMDSPAHHVIMGEQMLAAGEIDSALASFQTALETAPDYSPAHAGMARAFSTLGNDQDALKSANLAIKKADNNSEEVSARLAKMEVLASAGSPIDIREMEKEYNRIQRIAPGHSQAGMVMAGAYAQSGQAQEAIEIYQALVRAGGPDSVAAEQTWKKLHDRERLESDVRAAAELAGLPVLTRAQAAALIAEELKGWELIEIRVASMDNVQFLTPEQVQDPAGQGIPSLPYDVSDHPLAHGVILVLGLDLRGLEMASNNRFNPEAPMTRADMALALEDLVIIIEDDESLARRFVGSVSPFSDVSPDLYAFNAILLCVSRGLMSPVEGDKFQPGRPVSGMTALQGVQRIKAMTR